MTLEVSEQVELTVFLLTSTEDPVIQLSSFVRLNGIGALPIQMLFTVDHDGRQGMNVGHHEGD